MTKPNLAVQIAGLQLKNPVLVASGTFGFGREYGEMYDIGQLGGIMVKGLTPVPREGNPAPRIQETSAGMLNCIGLQNPGLERFISEEIPFLRERGATVIANISASTSRGYAEMAERLSEVEGVHAIEMNLSCPNVAFGTMEFGTDARLAGEVVSEVRAATKLPVIAKLSPNVTSIVEIAKSVEAAGADSVSLINTLLGMAINVRTRRPQLSNKMGGLSGPAVKPVAVRMVWQVAKAVKIPIIGMGGICTLDDALEFFLAGATAIAIGTANFVNPFTPMEIIAGLTKYLQEEKITDISELVGAVQV